MTAIITPIFLDDDLIISVKSEQDNQSLTEMQLNLFDL